MQRGLVDELSNGMVLKHARGDRPTRSCIRHDRVQSGIVHEMSVVIPRRILTDETYDAIMRLLMNHQIQPGERINIDALSRRLGVSVTPVRETLARLESEALVTKQPLVGYTATPLLTLEQMSDMYDVRLSLESLAARQAALRSTQEQVDEIAANVGGRRESTTGSSSDEHLLVALEDERFHAAIGQVAQNSFLRDAVERLHSHLHLYRLYQNARVVQEATMEEHELIVEALRRRDPDAAEQAMRAHLEGSRARLADVVKGAS
jgi:DNA-binding GntR family transcriptional regulator